MIKKIMFTFLFKWYFKKNAYALFAIKLYLRCFPLRGKIIFVTNLGKNYLL